MSVFVHAQGLCESDTIGAGTRVWGFAHVMQGAVLGRDCNICGHVFIEAGARLGDRVVVKNGVQVWNGVTLEDDVFVGPNATFTNDPRPRAARPREQVPLIPTRVRAGATIGANATLLSGIEIGSCAFVAAGAVVTRSVPAHALVAGNPATAKGWVCACGEGLDADLACVCGDRYRLLDAKQGLELITPAVRS
jgi:UDP-2-acetamido-3-amino-2,3-dideoxy-glucuronate N-acetyltransferase